jgi:CRISPR-associated protein Csb1
VGLTYEALREAVAGDVAGVRCVTTFEPLGGPQDKVFPPTYGVGERELRYAVEQRMRRSADGSPKPEWSVVLDSVASQANRAELALLEAIRDGRLPVPATTVDFTDAGLYGIDRISDFEASHRIFDALLRDSFHGEDLFRDGPVGRAVTDAVPRNAAGLLRHSPHTLVFGGWDSTGPKGGRGAKYERALTSEIVAHGIAPGVKTASRLDAAAIELKAGPVYESDSDVRWTVEPAQAKLGKKGEPLLAGRDSKAEKPGRPSQINHGNVTPSIDARAGGVTAERIAGTSVLSLIQLRRLRFPTDVEGSPIPVGDRRDAEVAARAALAALGVAATVLSQAEGFDLRSRCVLIPTSPLSLEFVARGGDVRAIEVDPGGAVALVAESLKHAEQYGLGWRTEEVLLRPSERLVTLIRRSQELSVAGDDTD